MSRSLIKIICLIAVLAVAVYGGLWLLAQRIIPLSVSLADRTAVLNNAEETLALGSRPENWPVRLFIPAGALQDISATVIGTKYRVPFGDVGSNGPDGYVVAKVRKLEFVPGDLLLRARVELDISYLPVRRSPWWGNATIRLGGKADIVPLREKRGDTGMLYFRLVPTGFSPGLRWGPLNLAAREMLSQVIASHLLDRLGRELLIPIPALKVPVDINSGMAVTHEGSFPVDGGYRLTAQFDGRSLHGEMSTDRLLAVSSGIWLLGGLPGTAEMPPTLRSSVSNSPDLEQRQLRAAAGLAPFERKSGHAEAHIPIAPVLKLAEAAAYPETVLAGENASLAPREQASNYNVRIAITEATGTLFKTQLVSNRIAGDVDLAVSPAAKDFASGRISFAPPQLQWQKGIGLTGRLDATVEGKADFRATLSGSRLGLAKSADLGVSGSTKTSLPFSLNLKLVREAADSAIFLVPDVGCTRITLNLRQSPGSGPLFPAGVYRLNSVGVRIDRNIGGGAPASIALIDSKPRYVPFPAGGPLADDISYPTDGVAITTSPTELVIGEDGINVVVSLHARGASRSDEAGFTADRTALIATLRKGLPAKTCDPDQRFRPLL